jgi:SH3 domain protein
MENKRIKLTIAMLLCGLTLSNSALAEPEVEPTEPETKAINAEEKTDAASTPETVAVPAVVAETVEKKSPIVKVTPYEMFISDELFVYIHSGSSSRYRIIGRVPASDKITVITKNVNTGWLEIKLSDNKTGWIDSTLLVDTAGVKAKLATANATIKDLNVKMSKLGKVSTDDLEVLETEIAQLTTSNSTLSEKLLAATTENETLRASVEQIDETKRILAKLYDVGAVLLGVFVGWLLTRRNKQKQWN